MAAQGRVTSQATGWVGWIAFAAALMLVVGAFNAVNGLAAIFEDELFVTGAAGAVVFDLTTWGWIHLLLGILAAAVGLSLMAGAMWARVAAVGIVMVNMLSQVLFLPAYPFWAMLIIVVDLLVLWALIVHGDETLD